MTICLPMQETQELQVQFWDQEDPVEKEIATHSSILAWEIPWIKEPGGVQSLGLQRVGYDLAIKPPAPLLRLPMFSHPSESKAPCLVDTGSRPDSILPTPLFPAYPVHCSPLDSSVHGLLQARILEWVTISFFSGSSQPRDQTQVPHCRQTF